MKKLFTVVAAISTLAVSGSCLAASERMDDGRKAYEKTCATCHETGIQGAPQTRNTQDWDNRSNLWDAVLFEHAEKGYLGMPARGDNKGASDYDVDAAAEYMLTITHPHMAED